MAKRDYYDVLGVSKSADNKEIKDHMTMMHRHGEFDDIICFGIELSENQLYKKFHPS